MRLNIRKMRSSDAQSLYELLCDVHDLDNQEEIFSFEEAEEFLKENALCTPPKIYAVDDEAIGFIGYVVYSDFDEDHIEIGWKLKQAYSHSGYVRSLISKMIEMTFNEKKSAIIKCLENQDSIKRIVNEFGFELIDHDNEYSIYELRVSHSILRHVNHSLRRYVIENILIEYENYEKSHGPEHIKRVIDRSLKIASGMDVDLNMVYCAAAYHDIGLKYGRDDHEVTSAVWLMKDDNLDKWFTREQKITMAKAIEDHRASNDSQITSVYGLIVSEADRDIVPSRVIRRCIEFECSNHPNDSLEKNLERILGHIVTKYGPDGYLKLRLPDKDNEEGLKTIRDWIRNDKLKDIVMAYLKEYYRKQK